MLIKNLISISNIRNCLFLGIVNIDNIYPMDFKMNCDGKGDNPRGERVQQTKRQFER